MNESGAVVIGCSAGCIKELITILSRLPADFPLPVLITLHLDEDSESHLAEVLNASTGLEVKEAEDKEMIEPGMVYTAPGGYHLLVEKTYSLSLSVDDKVNFARPSIDVLFETAADTFGPRLTGVLLSGGGVDGINGLRRIKQSGGTTVAQQPETAEIKHMPENAIKAGVVDMILPPVEIARLLHKPEAVNV